MNESADNRFRHKLHTVIYEADTPLGKVFDLVLLGLILLSIAAVMLESIASIKIIYGEELAIAEWIITAFFTLEYIGRLFSVKKPIAYATSLYGIIDLLALLPSYVDLFVPGWHFLIALRAIRLLRVFRILKLVHFVGAANHLKEALKKSREKIFVFLFTVIVLCVILGTVMYIVEGPEHGFTSIPMSVYWTVVTLTTVGFGDITPSTGLGQFISVIIMILGYGIIAVPTGLVGAQLMKSQDVQMNTQKCRNCNADHHRDDAKFCYNCGHTLNG
ncbi:ion transporter [Flavobacterium sp.]|uniref:ion transporter n=1 Tax=Flavobacterium sp. TaxID=239 RepID=UPI0011F4ECBD|nr:ion transporter [Flavobacterium sp.]RZJ70218.1 MAG: ion transporter [Flavobacterium sp.]